MTATPIHQVYECDGFTAIGEAGRTIELKAENISQKPSWHPLAQGITPLWASGWGQDREGIFTEFTIGTVTQRMRWIRPCRFLMGSPETEAGRYDNEGPRHEVMISRGFWLFDTPCTQNLWQVVMGQNPSRFQDPARPVETVSWNEVQAFLVALNEHLPGLDLSLPSEAQWEYACWATTETATYAGDLQIIGQNNARVLDPIAWYGGNSGKDFDLAEGVDSVTWSEKRYPHEKAGTRKVRRKRRNGFGLYDMLGNVFEWCADGMRDYEASPITDPIGPTTGDARRVLRGGAWGSSAQYVRSAYRNANVADDRGGGIGFRCARVQDYAEP